MRHPFLEPFFYYFEKTGTDRLDFAIYLSNGTTNSEKIGKNVRLVEYFLNSDNQNLDPYLGQFAHLVQALAQLYKVPAEILFPKDKTECSLTYSNYWNSLKEHIFSYPEYLKQQKNAEEERRRQIKEAGDAARLEEIRRDFSFEYPDAPIGLALVILKIENMGQKKSSFKETLISYLAKAMVDEDIKNKKNKTNIHLRMLLDGIVDGYHRCSTRDIPDRSVWSLTVGLGFDVAAILGPRKERKPKPAKIKKSHTKKDGTPHIKKKCTPPKNFVRVGKEVVIKPAALPLSKNPSVNKAAPQEPIRPGSLAEKLAHAKKAYQNCCSPYLTALIAFYRHTHDGEELPLEEVAAWAKRNGYPLVSKESIIAVRNGEKKPSALKALSSYFDFFCRNSIADGNARHVLQAHVAPT